jgi:hypothetical protein
VITTSSSNLKKLRNMAAILATLCGSAQCLSLWLLPISPALLMTALFGVVYILLGLGLFGISRFSLFLAIVALPLRSWFGLLPLSIPAWEVLRIAGDLAIGAMCIPVLWSSLHPDYRKVEPGADVKLEAQTDPRVLSTSSVIADA